VKLLGIDITNQLGGIAKKVGVDLQSPQSHIDERMRKAAELKERALSGDRAAWEQLWQASGRTLPVRAPASAAPVNGSTGWPRVKPQLATMLSDLEAQIPGGPGNAAPGRINTGGDLGALGSSLTDQLPQPVKKAVDDTAKALGTNSSTVTWVALALGVVLVIRSLRS